MTTTIGKQIKFGTTERTTFIQQSASLTYAYETAEVKNHIGDTVTVAQYGHKVTGDITGKTLNEKTIQECIDEIKNSVGSILTATAFPEIGTNGTTVITSFKISESNSDFVSFDCSWTYFPGVTNS